MLMDRVKLIVDEALAEPTPSLFEGTGIGGELMKLNKISFQKLEERLRSAQAWWCGLASQPSSLGNPMMGSRIPEEMRSRAKAVALDKLLFVLEELQHDVHHNVPAILWETLKQKTPLVPRDFC